MWLTVTLPHVHLESPSMPSSPCHLLTSIVHDKSQPLPWVTNCGGEAERVEGLFPPSRVWLEPGPHEHIDVRDA